MREVDRGVCLGRSLHGREVPHLERWPMVSLEMEGDPPFGHIPREVPLEEIPFRRVPQETWVWITPLER